MNQTTLVLACWPISISKSGPFLTKLKSNTDIDSKKHYSKMHLMTFDPHSDLIWGLSVGQQGKISSGGFADIDKHTGTLCPKSAHTSKKVSLKPPVYEPRHEKT